MENLRNLSAAGQLKHSLADYEQRLAREIAIIQQMKFSGYFLIVCGLYTATLASAAFPWGRGADRRRARWLLIRWGLRISILCSMNCCLSAF